MNRMNLSNLYRKLVARLCSLMILPVLTPATVTVSWDANTENDLAGYRIYYGERSRNYDLKITAGKVTSHRIDGLMPGKRYFFAVTAYDLSGNESGFSSEVNVDIPQGQDDPPPPPPADDGPTTLGALVYNFPNPFRVGQETTTIRYELSSPGDITIEILDMNNSLLSRLVANGFRRAGENTQDRWDGRNDAGEFVANGVYFCRIRAGGTQRFVKIAVIR